VTLPKRPKGAGVPDNPTARPPVVRMTANSVTCPDRALPTRPEGVGVLENPTARSTSNGFRKRYSSRSLDSRQKLDRACGHFQSLSRMKTAMCHAVVTRVASFYACQSQQLLVGSMMLIDRRDPSMPTAPAEHSCERFYIIPVCRADWLETIMVLK